MTCQQQRLGMRQQTDRHLLPEERMAHLFLFTLLPGDQNLPACRVVHTHFDAFRNLKTFRPHLSAVNERQNEAIGKRRAQFFHQVERKARAAGPQSVQESDLWIKTNTLQRTAHIVHEKRIDKGKEGIDWIERRTPTARSKGKRILLRENQMIEDIKIDAGSIAFEPANLVDGQFGIESVCNESKAPCGLAKRLGGG